MTRAFEAELRAASQRQAQIRQVERLAIFRYHLSAERAHRLAVRYVDWGQA